MWKALSLSLELECPETKIGPRQTPPSRRQWHEGHPCNKELKDKPIEMTMSVELCGVAILSLIFSVHFFFEIFISIFKFILKFR